MIEVLNHGINQEKFTISCDKCFCRFTFTEDDVFALAGFNPRSQMTYSVYKVSCPECHTEIRLKKNRILSPKYEKATYLEEAERLAFKEYYENRRNK